MTSANEPVDPGRKNILTIFLLIAIILMFVYAVFGSRGVLRIVQAEEQKHDLELQLADLEKQQEQLKETIEKLRHDKVYLEKLARTRLGMVREGELIYHVTDNESEEKR